MHQWTGPVKVHWVKLGTYLYHYRTKDENTTTREMLDVVSRKKFWKEKTGNATTSWRSSVSIHCRTNSTFKMFFEYVSDKAAISSLFLTKCGFWQCRDTCEQNMNNNIPFIYVQGFSPFSCFCDMHALEVTDKFISGLYILHVSEVRRLKKQSWCSLQHHFVGSFFFLYL